MQVDLSDWGGASGLWDASMAKVVYRHTMHCMGFNLRKCALRAALRAAMDSSSRSQRSSTEDRYMIEFKAPTRLFLNSHIKSACHRTTPHSSAIFAQYQLIRASVQGTSISRSSSTRSRTCDPSRHPYIQPRHP